VPDGHVVLGDQWQQALDRLRVGLGEVDVAAPDPVLGVIGRVVPHPDRLRVVDDDHVPLAVEAVRVHLVVVVEQLPLVGSERVRVALQRVVEELGRVEELLSAHDHLPVGVQPDVPHQRDDRVKDLRNAAPEGGGAHVQDPLALEALGELADLVHQAAPRQVGVVRKRLIAQRYLLKHTTPKE
jgi:hypothetical protein